VDGEERVSSGAACRYDKVHVGPAGGLDGFTIPKESIG
jgi:hypothetical protein